MLQQSSLSLHKQFGKLLDQKHYCLQNAGFEKCVVCKNWCPSKCSLCTKCKTAKNLRRTFISDVASATSKI